MPKRGEVWLVDLGIAGKTRPVVIVARCVFYCITAFFRN